MFDQAPQDNDIRRVMDACLPGLENRPDFDRDVLRHVRGEIKVKKKLSVGFVLVIALVLAAVTALAAMTLNAYYEKAIEKEGESGRIQDWSTADKITLVDWMVEAGIELDEAKVAQLHNDGLSEDAKGTLAMEIINGYYSARDGILTSVDIIAKEKGPIEYWSLEDKAWLSEMMAKYQPEEVSSVNLLPTKGDITQEQAIEIMYAYYEKEYGLKRNDFDESKMTISFSEGTWDDGDDPQRLKTWGMDLWLKSDAEHPMGISILPDGTIKHASAPYVRSWQDDWYDTFMAEEFWTIDGMYRFQQEWTPRVEQIVSRGEKLPNDLKYLISKSYGLPASTDISRDKAYMIAQDAILSTGNWTKEKLRHFDTREAYRVDDTTQPVYWFVFTWSIHSEDQRSIVEKLYQEGEIPRRVIVKVHAVDGSVLSIEENSRVDAEGRLGM